MKKIGIEKMKAWQSFPEEIIFFVEAVLEKSNILIISLVLFFFILFSSSNVSDFF